MADPFGAQEQEILAGFAGIVIGKTNLPLVHEGEALFHIARFGEPDAAAEAVEVFQDEHDPSTDETHSAEPPVT